MKSQEMILTKEGNEQINLIISQQNRFQEEIFHRNTEITYLVASEHEKSCKIEDLISLVTELKKELS